MKNYALRILSLLLVVATLSLMVSCDLSSVLGDIAPDDLGNGIQNGASEGVQFTPGATEKHTNRTGWADFTGVIILPTPEIDFEGEELVVLYRDNIQNSREWFKEEPEDELDEAVAQRNQKVEETLNINVRFEPVPTNSGYDAYTAKLTDMICNDVDADLHNYDISANHSYATAYPAIRDYAANLFDNQIFPYFDFESPCWNQSIVKNTTINDRLHYIAGDINLSMFDAACVVWHNATLYDRYKEHTDPENMQQLALDGFWTYDELYRWATRMYEDTNGIEGRQEDDTYGLLIEDGNIAIDAIPAAWEISFVNSYDDGSHFFTVSGNQKFEKALTKCKTLLKGVGTYTVKDVSSFAAGHSLFYMGKLYTDYDSNKALREMDAKYGLLPMPKYDVDQAEYGTTAQDYYTLMFVLDHSMSTLPTKSEAVSAYLQLSADESYNGVRGYYFNRIIKPKFFGVDDTTNTVTRSIAIFDIIVNNINFEFSNIYSPQLCNITWLWRDVINNRINDNTLESAYLSRQESFEQAIRDVDKWFGLN